ncbi:ATPase domain-containing protein [Fulvimarina sp. 2208YS6-2-32]|uniref:non-specific serine/threonine protein kinase n=1 Tax=Fulvimarina uroteuthidis TaxID=3098149 RepID=A0ABU5I226_9HYPH|nr:ATPase domain-containing protein [Fulvimarina sp. 2208YS6-2-32]MDY8109414.1 ATPase domain-containing protein [Fulvimarina sp. 2208YS6-2-32]
MTDDETNDFNAKRESNGGLRPLKRLPSFVPGFDDILCGGLVEGSSYIVQGDPGTGKTILANQLAFALARRGDKTLYMTLLSESFTQMFGFLQSIAFFDMSEVSRRIWYSSVFTTVREEGFASLLKLIHREIRTHSPTMIVIDGVFILDELKVDPNATHDFRRFLNDLTALTSQSGVTLLLLTNSSRKPSSPEYTMVDGWIELSDDLEAESPRRFLCVHKHRGGPILRGQHDYRISDTGFTVYPKLETLAPRTPNRKTSEGALSTGIDSLDTMLCGGFPAESATALVGPTGSGKTTIGMQYLAASTPDEKGLFFGFYESPDRICKRADKIGVKLRPLVDSGVVKMIWQPPFDNILDDLGRQIVEAVVEHGAKRVVIDGLNALQRPLNEKARLHGFLRALNQLIAAAGATIVYTREVPQLFFPSVLSNDDLSGLIDNTILLHYELSDGAIGQRIGILKVRDSDFDHRSLPFQISSGGMTIDLSLGAGRMNRGGETAGGGQPASGQGAGS